MPLELTLPKRPFALIGQWIQTGGGHTIQNGKSRKKQICIIAFVTNPSELISPLLTKEIAETESTKSLSPTCTIISFKATVQINLILEFGAVDGVRILQVSFLPCWRRFLCNDLYSSQSIRGITQHQMLLLKPTRAFLQQRRLVPPGT